MYEDSSWDFKNPQNLRLLGRNSHLLKDPHDWDPWILNLLHIQIVYLISRVIDSSHPLHCQMLWK